MENEKVKNIIRDTRRDIKYVILADRKLDRQEKLNQVRMFNAAESHNVRQKRGTVIELIFKEN
ncbi:MAG: hypothetical protein KAH48_00890 [Chlorobi bacterium]|nr:hypothetical protein [Chlorobiota bacterium]